MARQICYMSDTPLGLVDIYILQAVIGQNILTYCLDN